MKPPTHMNTIHYPRYVVITQSPKGHYRVHMETEFRSKATAALRPIAHDPDIPYMYAYDRQTRCRYFQIGTEVKL